MDTAEPEHVIGVAQLVKVAGHVGYLHELPVVDQRRAHPSRNVRLHRSQTHSYRHMEKGEARELMIEEPDPEIDFCALVRADQALDWLTPILGGRTLAKADIADRMRDGSIEVFARRAWDTRATDPATAWKDGPDEDDEFTCLELDINVDTWIWRRSKQWLLDQMDWRWPSGRFSVVHCLKPFHRVLFEHIHFDPKDIKKIGELHSGRAGRAFGPIPLASEGVISRPNELDDTMFEGKGRDTKKPGRHWRGQAWARVLTELWRLREAGELSNGTFNGKQNLAYHCSKISKQFGNEGLQQGTIEPLITALITCCISGVLARSCTR